MIFFDGLKQYPHFSFLRHGTNNESVVVLCNCFVGFSVVRVFDVSPVKANNKIESQKTFFIVDFEFKIQRCEITSSCFTQGWCCKFTNLFYYVKVRDMTHDD